MQNISLNFQEALQTMFDHLVYGKPLLDIDGVYSQLIDLQESTRNTENHYKCGDGMFYTQILVHRDLLTPEQKELLDNGVEDMFARRLRLNDKAHLTGYKEIKELILSARAKPLIEADELYRKAEWMLEIVDGIQKSEYALTHALSSKEYYILKSYHEKLKEYRDKLFYHKKI